VQHSLTSEVYTDAANTRLPSTNAQTGSLPGYQVTDLHAQWQFGKRWELKGGINNLFDVRYATRRSGGYPGPGILPADGRNLFLTLGATF
jgi:Fe(3+) dicitrate transport protein